MKKLSIEEAVRILENMKVKFPVPRAAETQIKRNAALEMAIKALATDINVGDKDTISRKAAIEAIDNCGCDGEDSCGKPWIYMENAVEAIEMVEPLPTAEPKKMHWKTKMSIRHINGAVCYIPKWHCPNCDLEYDSAFAQRVNFCYECGQRIEGLVDDVNEVTE